MLIQTAIVFPSITGSRMSKEMEPVEDVEEDGALQAVKDDGVEAEPFFVIGGRDLHVEMIHELVLGDDNAEESAPLGEVWCGELEGDRDDGLEVLDCLGLSLE